MADLPGLGHYDNGWLALVGTLRQWLACLGRGIMTLTGLSAMYYISGIPLKHHTINENCEDLTYPDIGGVPTLDDVKARIGQVNFKYGFIHDYVVLLAVWQSLIVISVAGSVSVGIMCTVCISVCCGIV